MAATPPSNLEIPSWAATALSRQRPDPPPSSQAAAEAPRHQPTPRSQQRAQPATESGSQSSDAAGARVHSVLPAVLALLEGCIGALAADVALAEALADGTAHEGSSLPVLNERCAWLCVKRFCGLACPSMACLLLEGFVWTLAADAALAEACQTGLR